MSSSCHSHYEVRQLQGFAVHVLRSAGVELAVVPELGARIVSLQDRRTGREWLWHPQAQLRLFRNHPAADFATSPLAGMDDCLPTIAPCSWRGRTLPDHGEIWNEPWQLQESAGSETGLTTSIRLKHSPFLFRRTVALLDNEVRLAYELKNLQATPESFVWAVHPLLRLQPGDELQLPASTRQLLNGHRWIDAVASAVPAGGCAKVFAHPVCEGWAAIANRHRPDRLQFSWNAEENPSLGLWLTRGGWHGHHHFAIEPTNASDDSLETAAGHNRCGTLAGHDTASWQLILRLGI
jgi:hypothetical protein